MSSKYLSEGNPINSQNASMQDTLLPSDFNRINNYEATEAKRGAGAHKISHRQSYISHVNQDTTLEYAADGHVTGVKHASPGEDSKLTATQKHVSNAVLERMRIERGKKAGLVRSRSPGGRSDSSPKSGLQIVMSKLPSKEAVWEWIPPGIPGLIATPPIMFAGMVILWGWASYQLGSLVCLGIAALIQFANIALVMLNFNHVQPHRRKVFHTQLLILLAIQFGSQDGMLLSQKFFTPYYSYLDKAQYKDVGPYDLATAHKDAGGIEFKSVAFPAKSMAVGFKAAGHIYCAAPVIEFPPDKTEQAVAALNGDGSPKNPEPKVADPTIGVSLDKKIQYWAVGVDCCSSRGEFECGDMKSKDARSGIVISQGEVSKELALLRKRNDPGDLTEAEEITLKFMESQIPKTSKFYKKAIDVAVSVYPVDSDSKNVIMVKWVNNLSAGHSKLFSDGVYYGIGSTFLFLLFIWPIALFLAFSVDSASGRRETLSNNPTPVINEKFPVGMDPEAGRSTVGTDGAKTEGEKKAGFFGRMFGGKKKT